jgi:REase_DpnII-MboI
MGESLAERVSDGGDEAPKRLLQIAESFHRVALNLRSRRTNRAALLIADEYDVQHVLGALLASLFQEVRPEEWAPSYAGSASRVDFLLRNKSIAVETKMTRDGLSDRKLGTSSSSTSRTISKFPVVNICCASYTTLTID